MKQVQCPTCQKMMDENSNYCPHCGEAVSPVWWYYLNAFTWIIMLMGLAWVTYLLWPEVAILMHWF